MVRTILLHWFKTQLEGLKIGLAIAVGILVSGALTSFAGLDGPRYFPNPGITDLLEGVVAACFVVTISQVIHLVACLVIVRRVDASYSQVWEAFSLCGEGKYIFLMYPGEFRRILAITEESLAALSYDLEGLCRKS